MPQIIKNNRKITTWNLFRQVGKPRSLTGYASKVSLDTGVDTWWASPLLPWISLGALFGLNQLDCCRQLHYVEIIEICRQSHEQNPCLPSHVCKVNGSSVARFRNRTTSIIDWYLVRWGLKSKHHKDTCLM